MPLHVDSPCLYVLDLCLLQLTTCLGPTCLPTLLVPLTTSMLCLLTWVLHTFPNLLAILKSAPSGRVWGKVFFSCVSQGYKQRDAFIMTQHPLPTTVMDFWTMVYDHDCKTIIMMNEMDSTDEVQVPLLNTCWQFLGRAQIVKGIEYGAAGEGGLKKSLKC